MILCCPICNEKLFEREKSYYCSNNHCFDLSKHGYLNLLVSKGKSGDNKRMAIARHDFLAQGHYDFLLKRILELLDDNTKTILDCGCGEGYFTEKIASYDNFDIVGIDISKEAIALAAKSSSSVQYVVGNIFQIPLMSNSIDCIINICAPHFSREFQRVLKENGLLIKVVPGVDHLLEVKKVIYSTIYQNDVTVHELDDFELILEETVTKKEILNLAEIAQTWQMTPYYYRTSKKDWDNINNYPELEVTFSFKIYLYKVVENV